jgi:hypothetical protein
MATERSLASSCRLRLRSQFLSWHESHRSLSDTRIDRALGIRQIETERKIDLNKLVLEFQTERLAYSATPYNVIRDVMRGVTTGSVWHQNSGTARG